ncbi:MAG: S41 family peptidase [Candidatus Pacebacteria bacterium]|nr:S41 family peptidase [Candidatus Paceibacterota bacterium]MDD4074157.1 S41 family peptidase [Candidatus Paceibacterota bacterium]
MKVDSKIIGLFFVLISFIGGFYFHQYLFEDYYERAYSDENIDFSLLKKTLDHIYISYINQDKIDLEKMTYGAISGMVKALDDPYTEFFDPEGTEDLQETITGSFEGIGLQIAIKDNKLTAISPIKGTPAEKAELKPKDIILAINGESTINLSIDEAVKKIRGEKGTNVILTIERDGHSFDIEITRAIINVPTVEWELIETETGKKIAHLGLYHFSNSTYQDFKKISSEILNSKAEGIILDLRSNPGGLVNQAIDVAGWFLNKEQTVMIEKNKDNIESEIKSSGPSNFSHYPLVILIDEGTASAAEILAGAIKDNKNTLIIGQKSFGKGTVQKVISLSNKLSLKLTIAEWLTPNRNKIDGEGILPNIEIEFDNDNDSQLEKALEEINKII